MKRSTLMAVGGAGLGMAGVAAARSILRMPHGAHELRRAHSQALSYREIMPGVGMARLRGDPDHGPYACFTRFRPGVTVPMHTHPSDITIVVLSGAYLYGTDEGVTRMEAGTWFVLPAGLRHWSGSDEVEGLLMYQEGSGRFGLDLIQ